MGELRQWDYLIIDMEVNFTDHSVPEARYPCPELLERLPTEIEKTARCQITNDEDRILEPAPLYWRQKLIIFTGLEP